MKAPEKFTPGPWHLVFEKGVHVCADGHPIATCNALSVTGYVANANARLIAAAPALYAALTAALRDGWTSSVVERCIDALAAARGES